MSEAKSMMPSEAKSFMPSGTNSEANSSMLNLVQIKTDKAPLNPTSLTGKKVLA